MKRPIYWRNNANATEKEDFLTPVYGIGPWWAHLIHRVSGWLVATIEDVMLWSECHMTQEE